MDPALVAQTAQSVTQYMGVKSMPKTDTLYTNQFLGGTKLTDAEWKAVEERSKKYLPKNSS
jgi:hypothetical protein